MDINSLTSFAAIYPKLTYLYVPHSLDERVGCFIILLVRLLNSDEVDHCSSRGEAHKVCCGLNACARSLSSDLAYNKLTEVPAIISKYKLLKTLYVRGPSSSDLWCIQTRKECFAALAGCVLASYSSSEMTNTRVYLFVFLNASTLD